MATHTVYMAAGDKIAAVLTSACRFYNIANGTHFYTASEMERHLTRSNRPSFVYEGVAFYVAQ